MTVDQRFEASYIPVTESGCWLWIGSVLKGYGHFQVSAGLRMRAHRFALTRRLGRDLADGAFACHRCDVPLCVNPDHLFEGTHQENVDDKVRKGRQARNHGATFKTRCHGERHHSAKITFEIAQTMRASRDPPAVLAARYGIALASALKVLRGITWKSPDRMVAINNAWESAQGVLST